MDPVKTPQDTEINIFDDARKEQEEQYKKVIKNARTSLFILAGLQLGYSLYLAFSLDQGIARIIEIAFGVSVSSIYAAMAFLSKRKPFIALIIGSCVYTAVQLLGIYNNPENMAKAVFVKVLVISWLVKGISNARRLEVINRDYAE